MSALLASAAVAAALCGGCVAVGVRSTLRQRGGEARRAAATRNGHARAFAWRERASSERASSSEERARRREPPRHRPSLGATTALVACTAAATAGGCDDGGGHAYLFRMPPLLACQQRPTSSSQCAMVWRMEAPEDAPAKPDGRRMRGRHSRLAIAASHRRQPSPTLTRPPPSHPTASRHHPAATPLPPLTLSRHFRRPRHLHRCRALQPPPSPAPMPSPAARCRAAHRPTSRRCRRMAAPRRGRPAGR
jgi:hypothetical protein